MKSSVFISLIKACQNKNGDFNLFNRCCVKDPVKFFKLKNVIDEYNSLSNEEQEIFRDDNKFFDLLSKYGFKTEENVVRNLYPRCKICGAKTEFIVIQLGYKNTCSDECVKLLYQKSCVEKYGCKNAFQSEEVKEKIKKSNLERYGVEHPNKSNIVKEKRMKTCIEKYGTENPAQKHFKNLDKLNIAFIKENFVEGKKFDMDKIREFFNIKARTNSVLINELIVSLKQEGYRQRTVFVTEDNFLDEIETSLNTTLKRQYRIPNTTFKTDGYDPKTNTIYEFLGDYWHGNPKVHDFDKVNVSTGFSFKELNQKTFERFDEIKKLGYNIKYIWENDYNESGLDALVDY